MSILRYLIKSLGLVAGLLILLFLHIAIHVTLTYPWSQINILFAVIVLLLLNRGSGLIVWVSCLLHFMVELYTVSPFGITLYAGTIATLLLFWLYQHVFTNRSWYAALALGFFSIVLFRSIYVLLLAGVAVVQDTQLFEMSKLLPSFAWEAGLTTLLVGILYGILGKVMRSFDTEVLRA